MTDMQQVTKFPANTRSYPPSP